MRPTSGLFPVFKRSSCSSRKSPETYFHYSRNLLSEFPKRTFGIPLPCISPPKQIARNLLSEFPKPSQEARVRTTECQNYLRAIFKEAYIKYITDAQKKKHPSKFVTAISDAIKTIEITESIQKQAAEAAATTGASIRRLSWF